MKRKIEISKYSDSCFGVKRAISLAEKALEESPGPIFSLGPLIHNQQVVGRLSKKGLHVVRDAEKIKRGTVVIRSHGIHPEALKDMQNREINIVNATCPFVENAQRLAERLRREGYRFIIIGDRGHPEVKSLRNFSGKDNLVVATREEANKLKLKNAKIGVITQTTQSRKNFEEVIEELLKKDFSEIRIFNTLCNDVSMRQIAARKLSSDNELVFVVGGKNSANTKRLYDTCKNTGTETYHVETKGKIKDRWLQGKRKIGIVSGASTPRWIVDEIVEKLKEIK